jgi:hypothetical protein
MEHQTCLVVQWELWLDPICTGCMHWIGTPNMLMLFLARFTFIFFIINFRPGLRFLSFLNANKKALRLRSEVMSIMSV